MLKNSLVKLLYSLYPLKRGKRFLVPLYKYVDGYEIINDKNNNKLLLNLNNYIDSIIYFEGCYEETHIKILYEKYLDYNCSYFIDIGANIGVYSFPFLKSKKNKECYLFEPEPNNFAQLKANIFLNNVSDKAKVFNCALSNHTTKATFYIENERKSIDLGKVNTGTHSLENNLERQHHSKIQIDVFRGDDLIKKRDEIICLKIDVEGHELSVLQGFENLLYNNKCLIFIEIFPNRFKTTNEYLINNRFKMIDVHFNLGDNYLYKNF